VRKTLNAHPGASDRLSTVAAEGRGLDHEEPDVPTFRVTLPDQPPELLEADYLRDEGPMKSLRGTALVMGRPREIVLRRVPSSVLVEQLPD
jgi:hypothetical protein